MTLEQLAAAVEALTERVAALESQEASVLAQKLTAAAVTTQEAPRVQPPVMPMNPHRKANR